VILCVAFLGGFLTSHFTSKTPSNANNNDNFITETEHNAQVQALMQIVEKLEDDVRHMQKLVDFYYQAIVEVLDIFDANTDLLHELYGELNDYRDLVDDLNTQIDTLQDLITEYEIQIENLQRELDFWLEADINDIELLQELISQNTALLGQVANLQNGLNELQEQFNDLFAEFSDLTADMIDLMQDNVLLNGIVGELNELIDELEREIEKLQNQAPQDDFYSNLGRTKNFVRPFDIMETGNEIFLWEHFDTQIFLDMYLWEWGNPFFGPTLIGYYVAFEFMIHTDNGNFEFVIEIIHDAGHNPMARAFKDGILQTQNDPAMFNISLTPVHFSYTFNPLPAVVEITAMYLERLTFVHLAPWRGGDA